jgi:transaldolase
MKFFLDTASLEEISWAAQAGLIDGVTTNPSLLARDAGDSDTNDLLKEICNVVAGPVSAEVVSVDADGMYQEGRKLARIDDHIVVKIPVLEEGMVATRRLHAEGIRVNVTLCFSSLHGMEVVRETRQMFDNYGIETELLAASIRHPRHVVEAALIGADVATVPTSTLKKLLVHPLTDLGLDKFLNDWSKLIARSKGGS